MAGKAKLKKMGKRTTIDESKLKQFMDPRLVFALSHAVRAHVLVVLNEGVSSPSAVGREIGVSAAYINYHFEELEREGLIELVKVVPRRGAREHFYRATRNDMHLSMVSMSLDARGLGDLSALLQEALARAKAIKAESAERLSANGEEPIPTTVAMLGFQTAAGSFPAGDEPAATE